MQRFDRAGFASASFASFEAFPDPAAPAPTVAESWNCLAKQQIGRHFRWRSYHP
ncbi:hypothetical protein [[Phormidium] sp. ETS-05]|uniref:hypothetical protein n=1 Tax=[Phormidium] sp. ETS-05 TaxID=222819 RepID=UPI0018EF0E28|nr:hypothetical protein [[Phormidium] sp. ETS-05]